MSAENAFRIGAVSVHAVKHSLYLFHIEVHGFSFCMDELCYTIQCFLLSISLRKFALTEKILSVHYMDLIVCL